MKEYGNKWSHNKELSETNENKHHKGVRSV